MSYNESESGDKSFRIGMMCFVMLILGLFLFLYKIEACKSSPDTCKDEYYELDDDMHTSHTCNQGAHAELVGPPAYPKRGVLCHCMNTFTVGDAGVDDSAH